MVEQTEHPVYQIKIKGELDPLWEASFEGLALSHDCEGNTILAGPIVDYTALYSILLRMRDLNLKLISVNKADCDSDDHAADGS